MEITNVKLNLIEGSKILAYATVTINDCIVISNIRLYEGSKGKFIVFHSRRSKKGKTRSEEHTSELQSPNSI